MRGAVRPTFVLRLLLSLADCVCRCVLQCTYPFAVISGRHDDDFLSRARSSLATLRKTNFGEQSFIAVVVLFRCQHLFFALFSHIYYILTQSLVFVLLTQNKFSMYYVISQSTCYVVLSEY